MPEEMMCCGTTSLKDVDKGELSGGGQTPRKEKKGATVAKEKKAPEVAKAKKTGKKENPYASLGLDKFSTVLAELETRREKVLRRVDGGGDRVMVRFVQSGAEGWVPIVVKLPPEDHAAKGEPKKKCKIKAALSPPYSQPSTPRGAECAWPREDVKRATVDAAKGEPKKKSKLKSAVSPPLTQPSTPRSMECAWPKEEVKRATVAENAAAVAVVPAKKKTPAAAVGRWSLRGKKVTRPSQYWPFAALLLLVSLVVFGRVFAICCTSIWWYLVPILSGDEEGRSVKTGKDLCNKSSDNKIVGKLTWASSPPSHGKKNSSGDHEVISPRSHAHGKKG